MTTKQVKELRDDLRDQVINKDYLKYKVHEAIQERDLNKIVANYVMMEELEKLINEKELQLQSHIQFN